MFPDWTWILGFWIGAAIGSFLNVVIYRMPRGIRLHRPASSFCPRCKNPLSAADLVPLLSWALSKGRCRYCGEKISARYFWVELFNGLIWAGIWYQYLVAGEDWPRAIAFALAASTLVAIIFIDWELYIIPDQINAFLWLIGILFNLYLFAVNSPSAVTWGMPTALAGWIVGVATLWGIAFLGRLLFGKDAMGHGDIKMARGIGAILGPVSALTSFGLAVALGAVLGIVQVLMRKRDVADEGSSDEEDQHYEPESIGSLIKCGFGYLLCIDIIGLLYPPLYQRWFGEVPFEPIEEEDDFVVENTMIPFGPYLALGAIVAVVFQAQLRGAIDAYIESATGILFFWNIAGSS